MLEVDFSVALLAGLFVFVEVDFWVVLSVDAFVVALVLSDGCGARVPCDGFGRCVVEVAGLALLHFLIFLRIFSSF